MRMRIIGTLFRWSKAIPVERAQDLSQDGKGYINFENNTMVKGIGT